MKLFRTMMVGAAVAAGVFMAEAGRTYELSVSYGVEPVQNFMATYRDHYGLSNAWGSVNIELARSLDFAPLKVGVDYSISSSPGLKDKSSGTDVSAVWHSLTANLRYTYYKRGRFEAYAHAALGVEIGYFTPSWRDSYNNTRFAWQASPIGLQYDFSRFAGAFVEAGMGTQGLVQVGVRVGL